MYTCHILIFIDCLLHCHDVHLHPSAIFIYFFSINISHVGVSNSYRLNGERRFLDLDSNINFFLLQLQKLSDDFFCFVLWCHVKWIGIMFA